MVAKDCCSLFLPPDWYLLVLFCIVTNVLDTAGSLRWHLQPIHVAQTVQLLQDGTYVEIPRSPTTWGELDRSINLEVELVYLVFGMGEVRQETYKMTFIIHNDWFGGSHWPQCGGRHHPDCWMKSWDPLSDLTVCGYSKVWYGSLHKCNCIYGVMRSKEMEQ